MKPENLERAHGDSSTIHALILSLHSDGAARFRAAKELNLIARDNPDLLYPRFEIFADLLDSRSSVLLWNGLLTLGYLARVDHLHRLDGIMDKYISHLWDSKLVTAANVVVGAGQILRFRPDLREIILPQLLRVDEIPLPTDECHQVIRGHVLSALTGCLDSVKDDNRIVEFALRCSQSNRLSTKKKAEELVRKLQW
ncbi:hypothetical protein Dform_00740 [Dehalogenimonas formicexedens]|uniref:HEAT repeat-containing protein n=1 Tax=Dehalogenimonas formicexedens TaxID=1839801 RepID=A0A1P8F6I4_9CHLR|nr:hypothetical protein [Dehalogenimonas formicexedens]APV44094.1 hypothetical protein Dform_00740 [Dehalogenimonas formicexedens]